MKKYLLLLLFLFPFMLIAGASTLHVNTEGWGTIRKNTGETSSKGSMFWNGSEWTTNETSVHMYYSYIETGQRVKTPVNVDISARTLTSSSFDTLGYHFVRKNYTYTDQAKQGGSYRYEAIQYQIEPAAGRKIVLRSRGTGNGIEKGYFNIYIEDSVHYITALRNDPLWFTYKGMTMDSALQQNSATQFLTGSLSSANGYYFLDVNGGADMGGLSYIFHTDSLKDSPKTDVLGSSYPVDFGFRCFAPGGGNIIEFRFLPKLVNETYLAPASLMVNTTTLNLGYTAASTATLAITSNTSWTVNTGQSWLAANPPSGTGNANVVLTALANKEPNNRIASVTVSATGTATQTITVTQSLNTGISELEESKIIVYPNPFTRGFHVSGIRGKATLRLADIAGRVLMVRETGGETFVKTGEFPAGIYFLRITGASGSREFKVVKK